jgi:hypothetical protein
VDEIVKIRASVFIGGMSWLPPIKNPETSDSPASMAGDMEYHFEKTV